MLRLAILGLNYTKLQWQHVQTTQLKQIIQQQQTETTEANNATVTTETTEANNATATVETTEANNATVTTEITQTTKQPETSGPRDIIYIGKKPLMAYVTSTLIQLSNIPCVTIKARGMSIGRAVDVSQIISRKTENAGYSIGKH